MAIVAELHPSSQETASGNSAAFKSLGDTIGVSVDVSAWNATTLDFEIEWSPDGTNFGAADGTADTLAQFAGVGTSSKAFDTKAPYFRLKWTLAGTDATFLVNAYG